MAWIITRDGKPTYGRYDTEAEVGAELHRRVPYSNDHAVTHEGYGVEEVPDNHWSPKEAEKLRTEALRMLSSHGHSWAFRDNDERYLVRENCGACVLNGYRVGSGHDDELVDEDEHTDWDGPNYAGWVRIYVQAGRPIPAKWKLAWYRTGVLSENEAYASALLLDIATFDVTFEEGPLW